MTIASELNRIIGAKDDIIDAIEGKGVTVPEGKKIHELAPYIDDITTGTPTGHKVQFFDPFGTLIETKYIANGQNVTPPTPPTHALLTFAHWNHPCTNITRDENIGAIYDTTDGKTYIFGRFNAVTGLQPTISFKKSTGSTLTINWGDGETSTSTSTSNTTLTKPNAYAAAGDYTITVEDSGAHDFGHGSFSTIGLMGSTTGSYTNAPTKIYIGANTTKLNDEVCRSFRNLKYITYPSNITGHVARGLHLDNHNLIATVYPSGVTGSIQSSVMTSCNNLLLCSLAYGMTGSVDGGCWNANRSLVDLILPPGLTGAWGTNNFSNCVSLEKLIIPDGLTGNLAGISGCVKLKYLKWSQGITGSVPNYDNGNQVNLETLILPANMTGTIGMSSFSSYYKLQTLNLPAGMTGTIGDGAIRYLNSLKSLTIPIGITGLNVNCLADNISMEEYIFQSTTPPTMANTNVFSFIPAHCRIYVPDANVNDYKTATNWSTYANYIFSINDRP
jgi:hypothetical protein